eukprot:gene625-biopygen949
MASKIMQNTGSCGCTVGGGGGGGAGVTGGCGAVRPHPQRRLIPGSLTQLQAQQQKASEKKAAQKASLDALKVVN